MLFAVNESKNLYFKALIPFQCVSLRFKIGSFGVICGRDLILFSIELNLNLVTFPKKKDFLRLIGFYSPGNTTYLLNLADYA